jgi:hypothetical protein
MGTNIGGVERLEHCGGDDWKCPLKEVEHLVGFLGRLCTHHGWRERASCPDTKVLVYLGSCDRNREGRAIFEIQQESGRDAAVESHVRGFGLVDWKSVIGGPFHAYVDRVLQSLGVFRPNLEVICIEGRRDWNRVW